MSALVAGKGRRCGSFTRMTVLGHGGMNWGPGADETCVRFCTAVRFGHVGQLDAATARTGRADCHAGWSTLYAALIYCDIDDCHPLATYGYATGGSAQAT